jgi:hypothetical protein
MQVAPDVNMDSPNEEEEDQLMETGKQMTNEEIAILLQ